MRVKEEVEQAKIFNSFKKKKKLNNSEILTYNCQGT